MTFDDCSHHGRFVGLQIVEHDAVAASEMRREAASDPLDERLGVSFAVTAIRRWWQKMGRAPYAHTRSLVITADAGGSNGARLRLWKWELQRFANRTGLTITVCHFPPGTSKWNRIEHRLFSHIAMNWRGTPLVDLATIVSLIGSTHSRAGLRVRSELDRGRYPDGVTITDAQMATIRLQPHHFHGEWNYTIYPTTRRRH